MSDHSTEVTLDINEQIAIRRTKLAELRKSGQAYPNDFRRHDLAADLHAKYGQFTHDQLEEKAIAVQLAGRMMTRRLMGKASFAHIQDMSGRIQLYVKQDDLSPEMYEAFKRWDLGDILGVKGILFKTKTDELSVKVTEISLLTKSLLPLPDKFHGLTDQEMRYRKRYLDLIANEQARQVFHMRSATVAAIRSFLDQRGYMEVETPMMHQIPGGAAARPFITHHNTLDMDLFLRIAPELYLKRLVVGGFEKVYEINRNFRNEGLSTRHNPEFTMLEFYQAYADYNDLINLTEEMMRYVAEKVLGTLYVTYQGNTYDLAKPFQRLTMEEAILKYNPKLTKQQLRDFDQAVQLAKQMEIPLHPHDGLGKIWYEIFERTVEAKLTEATFITAFPMEVSPLARKNDKDPFITDRFEFFIGGREIANGFSELNDPEDQAQRFKEQVKSREHGDLEAMYYDADYITALEYGLPPTAGEGIGIDRLVMFLTDSSSIRDVILFPQMRPQED